MLTMSLNSKYYMQILISSSTDRMWQSQSYDLNSDFIFSYTDCLNQACELRAFKMDLYLSPAKKENHGKWNV